MLPYRISIRVPRVFRCMHGVIDVRSRIHAGPACYLNLDRVFPIDRKRLRRFCAEGVRLTLPRSVFKPGFLLVGLLGYRHTVTQERDQERDPTIVAHRYDLLKISKLQYSFSSDENESKLQSLG